MIRPIHTELPRMGLRPRQPEPAPAAKPKETGTALVLVTPVEAGEQTTLPPRRTSASYLAHLIATDRGEPQTRERRRATAHEAIAAYGAAKKFPRENMKALDEA
jgi:hypothetical protein